MWTKNRQEQEDYERISYLIAYGYLTKSLAQSFFLESGEASLWEASRLSEEETEGRRLLTLQRIRSIIGWDDWQQSDIVFQRTSKGDVGISIGGTIILWFEVEKTKNKNTMNKNTRYASSL